MSILSEQHRQWHQEFGKYAVCNLDCGANEIVMETFEADRVELEAGASPRIHCWACKGVHSSVAVVKFCCELRNEDERRAKRHEAMGY